MLAGPIWSFKSLFNIILWQEAGEVFFQNFRLSITERGFTKLCSLFNTTDTFIFNADVIVLASPLVSWTFNYHRSKQPLKDAVPCAAVIVMASSKVRTCLFFFFCPSVVVNKPCLFHFAIQQPSLWFLPHSLNLRYYHLSSNRDIYNCVCIRSQIWS